MTAYFIVDLVLGGIAVYILKELLTPKKTPAPLPPGPKGMPIVGNLNDLPPPGEQEWVHWSKHKECYGPISCVTVLGQTIIILNDPQYAVDLLEKRSTTMSDRPNLVFANELCGWGGGLFAQMYGGRFKLLRKNLHSVIGSKNAIANFGGIQEKEVKRFCYRILQDPKNLTQHIKTEAGAIILNIAYGYDIEPFKSDPLIDIANTALETFAIAALPGRWMVDQMPFLKNIPDWFPGASFKQTGARWKSITDRMMNSPYFFTKHQFEKGKAKPSFVTSQLEIGLGKNAEEEYNIKWAAGSLYGGGADTTVSSIQCFFLAMTIHPEVQRKAQEELDRVIGSDRLPTFADRPDLPYVEAVMREVLRWHPVAPMGLPHVSSREDIYQGYFIPKGSLLLANIWGFMHDPKLYSNPDVFNPDRFLGLHPELDSHAYAFGFGRRVCPGRELADASVWLSVAMSLAAFDITRTTKDTQHIRFTPGIISHPEAYDFAIMPRSNRAAALVKAVEDEYPFMDSDAAEYTEVLKTLTY